MNARPAITRTPCDSPHRGCVMLQAEASTTKEVVRAVVIFNPANTAAWDAEAELLEKLEAAVAKAERK